MYPIDPATQLDTIRERSRWTTKKPHVSGYYWLRNWNVFSGEPMIVEFWHDAQPQPCIWITTIANDYPLYKVNDDAEWIGPLEPPC